MPLRPPLLTHWLAPLGPSRKQLMRTKISNPTRVMVLVRRVFRYSAALDRFDNHRRSQDDGNDLGDEDLPEDRKPKSSQISFEISSSDMKVNRLFLLPARPMLTLGSLQTLNPMKRRISSKKSPVTPSTSVTWISKIMVSLSGFLNPT